MAKYLEVLKDGLTVARKVQMAGARVQVPHEFPFQTKKEQTARWGAPRYREITEADFVGTGGTVQEEAAPAEAEAAPEEAAPEEAAEAPEAEASVDKFATLAGMNVEETLQVVADFDEETVAEFAAWEQENASRKGVLEPLGYESEE